MKPIMRVAFVAGALSVMVMAQEPAQPAQRPRFSFATELRGRHPRLFEAPDFTRWLDGKTIGPWHESPGGADLQMLVVQDAPGNSVFAAQLSMMTDDIQGTHVFDLQADKKTRAQVAGAIKAANLLAPVHAIRPNVSRSNNTWTLEWEIEVRKGNSLDSFIFTPNGSLTPAPSKKPGAGGLAAAPGAGAGASAADDLASNELHHLKAFEPEVKAWISKAKATTVQEKAWTIYNGVAANYHGDGSIVYINDFTWSDELTKGINKGGGMCDEFSVVTVTYLRAVGIPARIKYLVGDNGTFGHAVVEYSDGGTWRHMDAMWRDKKHPKNAFNNEALYRALGHKGITVLDVDWPDDTMCTNKCRPDAWGRVPDPDGDGMLNTWEDFKITPAYPGTQRNGYSK